MTDVIRKDADLSDDEATIWELHREFMDGNRRIDATVLERRMVEGADGLIWYNLNQSNYHGLDHIAKLWRELRVALVTDELTLDPREERVEVYGDVAVVSYLGNWVADFGDNGGLWEMDSRVTEVWRRTDEGWKMFHFHCSQHVPGVMGGL